MILRHRTSAAWAATLLGGIGVGACDGQSAPDESISTSAASFVEDGCGLDGMCAASGCEYDPDCCAISNGTCESTCEFDGVSDPDCAPVESGCTLTQGYWKTHYAGAKNASQNIDWPQPGDENNLLCGKTWLSLLQTAPKGGDAWLVLAHQWIAATLNRDAGASAPADVQQALTDGGALLAQCTTLSGPSKARATNLAGLLDQYNNGLVGPGHCD